MYRVHRMILFWLLALFLSLQGTSTVRADALEIVFKDSLWGAAIGGVGGLAAWALQDKDGEDKVFPKYVSRYAAIGVFLGMGYGIFDANQGGEETHQTSLQPPMVTYPAPQEQHSQERL